MRDPNSNQILIKSKAFALRIYKLCRYLREDKKEYELTHQLFKSGTSIGANVKEAIRGQSRADFKSKLNISLKEASETEYWLEILKDSETISNREGESILADCRELIKILTSIVKSCSN